MPRPAADETAARALRPRVRPGKLTLIEDSKVGQLLTLLDRSGVPQHLEELLAGRPGPPGVRPRTVLAGLLLAAYYTGRATIAEGVAQPSSSRSTAARLRKVGHHRPRRRCRRPQDREVPAGHPLPLRGLDRRLQTHPIPQRRNPRATQERRDRHRQPQTPARTRPGRPEHPRRPPGHRRQPRHPGDLALPAHRQPPHRHRLRHSHPRHTAQHAARRGRTNRPSRAAAPTATHHRLSRHNNRRPPPAPAPRGTLWCAQHPASPRPGRPNRQRPPSPTPNTVEQAPETTKIPTDQEDRRDLVNRPRANSRTALRWT